MKTPIYLVPMDFSTVSSEALGSALKLAHLNNGEVVAIHVVAKANEKKAAKEKFTAIVDSLNEADKSIFDSKVLVGNLYDDIAKAAEILGARLIVMGTHGAQGFQKLFGSHAVKLVSSTSVPFVIMQEGRPLLDVKTIVMPFSFETESIQIANYAGAIAKQLDATIHLVSFTDKDKWLQGQSNANQLLIKQLFDQNAVKYEIVNLDSTKNYHDELMNYTKKVHADLIASTFYIDTILPKMNTFIQAIIENNQLIPILTVNADEIGNGPNFAFLTI